MDAKSSAQHRFSTTWMEDIRFSTTPLLHFTASPLYRFADGWTDGRMGSPAATRTSSAGNRPHTHCSRLRLRRLDKVLAVCVDVVESTRFAENKVFRTAAQRTPHRLDEVQAEDFVICNAKAVCTAPRSGGLCKANRFAVSRRTT